MKSGVTEKEPNLNRAEVTKFFVVQAIAIPFVRQKDMKSSKPSTYLNEINNKKQ